VSTDGNEVSTNGKGASARVADVLKSGLERRLIVEDDAVLLAGHGSHVVTDKFEPGAATRDEDQMAVSWDDEKYREFAERLSELRDASAL
jgi:hypothetical protein